MKKKLFLVLFSIILIVFSSCTQPEPLDGNGRVIVQLNNMVRGISPVDMDVDSYEINIKNAEKNFDFTDTMTKGTASKAYDNVPSGAVTVVVKALNKDKVALGSGSDTKAVVPGIATTFTITITEFEGEGTLNITSPVKTDSLKANIYNATDVFLKSVDFVKGDTYTLETSLPKGTYTLRFFSGESEVAYFETVRIVKGHTTNVVLTDASYNIGTVILNVTGAEALPSDSDHYTLTVDNDFVNYHTSTNYKIGELPSSIVIPAGDNIVNLVVSTKENIPVAESRARVHLERGGSTNANLQIHVMTALGAMKVSVATTANFSDLKLQLTECGKGDVLYTISLTRNMENTRYEGRGLNLPPGFYDAHLVDSNKEHKVYQNVRVYSKKETDFSAEFTDTWHVDINITDNIQGNIDIAFAGNKAEYHRGEAYAISATVTGMTPTAHVWYFDDMVISNSNGSKITGNVPLNTPLGNHRIALKISDANRTWSESVEFTVTEEVKKGTAYGPVFAQKVEAPGPMTRGLHSLDGPTNYFDGDLPLAGLVMREMPLITSLKALGDAELNLDFHSMPPVITVYDQKIRLQVLEKNGRYETPCSINSDGIFLRYEILQDVSKTGTPDYHVVGYLDYYYSWVTKKFGYRQYWVNTMEFPIGPDEVSECNTFMSLEMTDISVDQKTGNYSYGQLDPLTGIKRNDCIHDTMDLGSPDVYYHDPDTNQDVTKEGLIIYNRTYPTLKVEDGQMNTCIFLSRLDAAQAKRWDQAPSFHNIAKKYLGDTVKITAENKDNLEIDFVLDLIEDLYVSGKKIKAEDSRKASSVIKPYSSYEEFVADSFREQRKESNVYDNIVQRNTSHSILDMQILFDTKTRTGITPDFYRICSYIGLPNIDTELADPKISPEDKAYLENFKAKYGLKAKEKYTPEEETWYKYAYAPHHFKENPKYEYINQFVAAHMKMCGITNENYIANTIYLLDVGVNFFFYNDRNKTNIVVDSRDPAAFREYVNSFELMHRPPAYPWK